MDDVKPTSAKRPRKFLLIGSMSVLAIVVLLAASHIAWLGAGSAEWQFKEERNGMKLWTLKTPGNPLLKGRAQFRVKSKLGGIVKIVYDLKVHEENNMMKVTFLDSARAPGYYSVFNTFTQAMPPPFKTREFMLLSQHVQDPQTKAIELNAMAAPNKIPASDCCVRLAHLHNRYILTPLENGEVDIDFFWDVNLGGAFPYALANAALPNTLYKAMDDFRILIGKYQNDEVDYIAEPSAPDVSGPTLSQSSQ